MHKTNDKMSYITRYHTYTWGISEALNCLKQSPPNNPHGEGTATVVHNAPWAVEKDKVR